MSNAELKNIFLALQTDLVGPVDGGDVELKSVTFTNFGNATIEYPVDGGKPEKVYGYQRIGVTAKLTIRRVFEV